MKLKNVKSKLNRKQKAFSSGKGTPSYKEGSNGDITVRNISGKGLFLYYKYQGKWYSTRLNKINPKYAEDKESVVVPKGRKPRKSGELTLDSGNLKAKKKEGVTNQVATMNSSNILDINEIQTQRTTTTGMGTDNGGTSDFKLVNTTGHSYIHIETQASSYDPYIMFAYRQVGESEALKQWTIGMDNSATDTLKFHYKGSGTAPLTPSSTAGGGSANSVMELTNSGALSVSGTVTSSNGVCGGPTVTNHITNDADDVMNGNLTLRKVSDDANAAELILQKERSDTTIDDNDYVGKILFKAYDDQGTPEIMTTGQISNQVLDASSNDEIAKMALSVLTDEFSDADVPTNFLTATGISTGYGNVQVNLGAGATTDTFIHGQTKFTASTNGSEATNGKIHVMPYASGASPNILIESLADNGDYLKLTVNTAGASTISTVDDGGTEADLTLDPDGELILTPVTEVQSDAPLKIKKIADAVADTGNYGQVWVHDTTPVELCFTDDAGTDIIGIGKYEYDIKFIGYNGYTTSSYLPINGYIFDQTSTTSRNEYHSFIAPYNGIIEKVSFRSEIAQDGDLRLDVLESADGTEVPGTGIFRGLTAVDIADDTYQELDMANPAVGTAYAPLTKGRIYVLYLICPSAPQDTNVTVVFKWDITT